LCAVNCSRQISKEADRGAADRGEYRQAAGAIAQAVDVSHGSVFAETGSLGFRDRARPQLIVSGAGIGSISELIVIVRYVAHH
jgi:hypothetical protein